MAPDTPADGDPHPEGDPADRGVPRTPSKAGWVLRCLAGLGWRRLGGWSGRCDGAWWGWLLVRPPERPGAGAWWLVGAFGCWPSRGSVFAVARRGWEIAWWGFGAGGWLGRCGRVIAGGWVVRTTRGEVWPRVVAAGGAGPAGRSGADGAERTEPAGRSGPKRTGPERMGRIPRSGPERTGAARMERTGRLVLGGWGVLGLGARRCVWGRRGSVSRRGGRWG